MAKEKFVNEIWDDLVDSFSNIRTGTSMPRYLLPNMPCLFGKNRQACHSCCVKLTLFKREFVCCKCQKVFCARCVGVENDKHTLVCRICAILLMRPPDKNLLLTLRVKDLQCFLTTNHVSTRGCVEKEDLVNLLLVYTNEKPSYGSTSGSTPDSHGFATPIEVGTEAQEAVRVEAQESIGIQVGVDGGTSGVVDLGASTNMEAVASTSYSSLTCDTATGPLEVGVSLTTQEVHTNCGASASPSPGPSSTEACSSNHFPEPSTFADNEESFYEPSAPTLEPPLPAQTDSATGSPDGPSLVMSYEPSAPTLEPPFSAQTDSATGSPVFVRPTMSAIGSRGDMEQMSVKQLKCLLASHRVDYHGCCEKAELVERATRLWTDYRAARADLDNLDLDELCKVCMDAPIECVMLECGHMATCTDCGRQLSECPICRQYVVRIVRTFRA